MNKGYVLPPLEYSKRFSPPCCPLIDETHLPSASKRARAARSCTSTASRPARVHVKSVQQGKQKFDSPKKIPKHGTSSKRGASPVFNWRIVSRMWRQTLSASAIRTKIRTTLHPNNSTRMFWTHFIYSGQVAQQICQHMPSCACKPR